MKKIIATTAILISLSIPAHAQDEKVCYPPITVQAENVSNEIVKQYIKSEGWCDKPVPNPTKGQIVVYYERDENGECVAKVKQGK